MQTLTSSTNTGMGGSSRWRGPSRSTTNSRAIWLQNSTYGCGREAAGWPWPIQRVRVGKRYVYPDVVVTCQEPIYADPRPRTLTNPELIVEVLSSPTAEHDLEDKLLAYTRLDSLKEYWIVSSARSLVMRYVRRGQEWVLRAALGLESTVQSDHFGIEIPMIDLYLLVFDEESDAVR